MDLSYLLSQKLGLGTAFGLKTSTFVQNLVAKPIPQQEETEDSSY